MTKAQDAGILGIDGPRSFEPDRLMQIAAEVAANPKGWKEVGLVVRFLTGERYES